MKVGAGEYDLYEWMRIPVHTSHSRHHDLERAAREWWSGHGLIEEEWRVLRDAMREKGVNFALVTDGRFPVYAIRESASVQHRVSKILNCEVFEYYLLYSQGFDAAREKNGGKLPPELIEYWNDFNGLLADFQQARMPHSGGWGLEDLRAAIGQATRWWWGKEQECRIEYPSAVLKRCYRLHEKRMVLAAMYRAFYGRTVLGAKSCSRYSAACSPLSPPPEYQLRILRREADRILIDL